MWKAVVTQETREGYFNYGKHRLVQELWIDGTYLLSTDPEWYDTLDDAIQASIEVEAMNELD